MYNYGYCGTPVVPAYNAGNNCGGGCGGFAFILVLFILLAIICGCGGFGFGGNNNGCGCDCGCQAILQLNGNGPRWAVFLSKSYEFTPFYNNLFFTTAYDIVSLKEKRRKYSCITMEQVMAIPNLASLLFQLLLDTVVEDLVDAAVHSSQYCLFLSLFVVAVALDVVEDSVDAAVVANPTPSNIIQKEKNSMIFTF